MAAKDQKYVVLHNQVGHKHVKGDVVTWEDLEVGAPEAMERLVDIKAVRRATNFEAGQTHVTLEATPTASVIEEELAQARERINRLAAELADRDREIQGLKALQSVRQPVPGKPEDQQAAAVANVKAQQRIMELEAQLKDLQGKVKR